ncbi:MAG: hypothetical protein M5U08_10910 [Burkholderiales bacterium]|nr:hypothetical protein [Burkholderiales bacterium]
MSDLQLSLLVIGLLVVAGVLAYNRWQERKLGRRGDAAFGSRHEDVLLRAGAPADTPPPAGAERRDDEPLPVTRHAMEHTIDANGVPHAPAGAAPPAAAAEDAGLGMLDEAVDCIVALELPTAAAGVELLRQAEALAHAGLTRPIHWEGFDGADGAWEAPLASKRYARARVGMQLANRSGPATTEDISAFFEGVQEAALALGAEIDLPDPQEALARAVELDRLCAEFDVQVGLNVIAAGGATFPGTKIRALAESAGMQHGKDGRYHRLGEGGAEHFGLANLEPMPFHAETMRGLATQGVTVILDVPRAPGSGATFRAFVEFARKAEQALGGTLVDDNRKPIDQPALDSIAMQLEAIQKTMASRGVAAGSTLALRLFA